MRRYTIYNRLTAVAAGLCLCWLFMACGPEPLCCNYHFADIPFGTPAADEGRRDDDEGG